MNEVFDYEAEMLRAAEAVRIVARQHTADDEPALARAVVLCAPYVRFPSTGIGRLWLDYMAGMEYGGSEGYSQERIQDECEAIECWYFDEIVALGNR
jgi:hypothetical protein